MLAAVLTALLGHSSFEVREAASESLSRLGCFAQPALTHALDSTDPERASRAARLLTRLRIETDPTALWLGGFLGLPYSDSLGGFGDYLPEASQAMRDRGIDCGRYPNYRLAFRIHLERHGPPNMITIGLMAARSAHWDVAGRYP